jgi:hypothetical protein
MREIDGELWFSTAVLNHLHGSENELVGVVTREDAAIIQAITVSALQLEKLIWDQIPKLAASGSPLASRLLCLTSDIRRQAAHLSFGRKAC